MKGQHSDMCLTMGQGAICDSSSEAMLDTVSLTKEDMLVLVERKHQKCCCGGCRIAQGRCSDDDALLQDNQSATLLENDQMHSSVPQTTCLSSAD